ncbi:MAG: enoyl-CoA hydratase/isomerase family protein [Methanobacteriota archaeon]
MSSPVLFEVERGGVARVTLNRPEVANALDVPTAKAFFEAVERAGKDPTVRALVVSGTGGAFCSGGDVRSMAENLPKDAAGYFRDLTRWFHATTIELRRMPAPVIAAIDGAAAGGGFGFALAADLRIGSDRARFKSGFSRLGVSPDGGVPYFLPRVVGPARAAEILFADRVVEASEAFAIGLLHKVVPAADLPGETNALAARIAAAAPESVRRTKRLLEESLGASLESHLEEERRLMVESIGTPDAKEGIRAFVERREPRFG